MAAPTWHGSNVSRKGAKTQREHCKAAFFASLRLCAKITPEIIEHISLYSAAVIPLLRSIATVRVRSSDITWEQFEANRARTTDNRPRWRVSDSRGAIRKGGAMLAGLLRCGHCGRRMRVSYSGTPLYICHGTSNDDSRRDCLSVGAVRVDLAVSEQLCRALAPVAIQAATHADALRASDQERIAQQARLRVQAAQYEADRALEYYHHVDPKNRLVADTLEERTEQRLQELRAAKQDLQALLAQLTPLSDLERTRLAELGAHFTTVWNHAASDIELRKQILRAAIEEVVLTHLPDDNEIDIVIHWKGGVHTYQRVHKRVGRRAPRVDAVLVDAVRAMADELKDLEIARVLNLNSLMTPTGLRWTMDRVTEFRKQHAIESGRPSPDFVSAAEAARLLGIRWTARETLGKTGVLSYQQVLPYAPWRIVRADLDSAAVRTAVAALKQTAVAEANDTGSQTAFSFTSTPEKG